MVKFIIVILPDEEGEQEIAELSTRRQFDTYDEAFTHSRSYSPSLYDRILIVKCWKGLTYD